MVIRLQQYVLQRDPGLIRNLVAAGVVADLTPCIVVLDKLSPRQNSAAQGKLSPWRDGAAQGKLLPRLIYFFLIKLWNFSLAGPF